MDGDSVFAFGVEYVDAFAAGLRHGAAVANLSAHLAVERRAVEDDLIEFFVFLFDFAVAQDRCVGFRAVIAHECRFAESGLSFVDAYPVCGFYSGRIACTGLLGGHFLVESGLIECHAVFFQDQFGQVDGESVSVVEHECLRSGNLCLALFACGGYGVFEQAYAVFESAQERVFLLFGDFHDQLALVDQFGIGFAHRLDQGVDQTIHECFLLVEEGVGIADGAAKYATDHVAGFGIGGKLGVGNGE